MLFRDAAAVHCACKCVHGGVRGKTGAGGAKNLLLKPIKLGGNAIGVQPSCGGHTIHDLVGDAHHGVQVANIVADPTPK